MSELNEFIGEILSALREGREPQELAAQRIFRRTDDLVEVRDNKFIELRDGQWTMVCVYSCCQEAAADGRDLCQSHEDQTARERRTWENNSSHGNTHGRRYTTRGNPFNRWGDD